MQPRDEAALRLHQANRDYPEIEALMDEFFGRISAARYECQLRLVSEEMASCPVELKELSV